MSDIKKYRNILQDISARIGVTARGLAEQASSPTGGENGASNAPIHLADMGSEAYTQELGAALLENEEYLGNEVRAAIGRLEGGTFGACESCGRGIAHARLEAIPYARYCMNCAQLTPEKTVNLNDGRPVEWHALNRHDTQEDSHAAGTPGGGTALGGLAGTNIGDGSPKGSNLEQSAGGREIEPSDESAEEVTEAYSGPSGGAVGGSPANKRARGGRPRKTLIT
jgi:RNA polymerase-binding transcription factor DksA